MIAIQVIPDRFEKVSKNEATAAASERAASTVRRMTNGIVLADETFATLRVVTGDGRNIPIIDGGSRDMKGSSPLEILGKRATSTYSNFLLQSVAEDRQEKSQIVETFGESFIFLFGERPKMMTFSGILANTADFNWEAEWWFNYDKFLRGTRCVENDAQVFLSFDHTIVGGFILGCSAQKSSQERNWVNFTFQMFVNSYTNFSAIGSPNLNDGDAGLAAQDPKVAAAFRPKIVPEIGTALRGYSGPGNISLASGFSLSKLNQVQGAIEKVKSTVSSTLQTLNNRLNGTIVRVPVGFEGSMVFDDDLPKVSLSGNARDLNGATPILFSEFKDNDAEYVGTGSHYGSAQNSLGAVQRAFEADPIFVLKKDQKSASDLARAAWRNAGLAVPEEEVGQVQRLVGEIGLGIVAASVGTAAWKLTGTQGIPDNTFSLGERFSPTDRAV